MLERERKESHAERVKLIHCIHLQQIELTQRAVASHEKAAEIAKVLNNQRIFSSYFFLTTTINNNNKE